MISSSTFKVTPSGDREILIARVFDAPRTMVWDTMTRPELLKRWLFGPPGWEMTVCEDDRRVGGEFRWEWRGPGGEHMVMHGVNREIVPPERGVRTEIFEMGCIPQTQSQEQLATLVLKELGGTAPGRKTLLNITVEYSSKEARDGMIASGMEHGMAAGYDRLDEILATMV